MPVYHSGMAIRRSAGVSVTFVLAGFAISPAHAIGPDIVIEAPPEIAEPETPFSDRVDFAWGVALTSNYISAGETQSGDDPAVQGYFEISSGIVYATVWYSTVELDSDRVEFDLTWGLRPSIGALSLDINYTRYAYDDTGDCCGDWIGKAEYEAGSVTLAGEIKYDPQTHDRSVTAGLAWEFADKFTASGEVKEKLVDRATSWNAGLTWQATDTLSLDLRYHGSEDFPDRYVATLAYDFSTAE